MQSSMERVGRGTAGVSFVAIARITTLDCWFRPRCFESERLYERLGALILKRYVPTGGDLLMRRLRRHHPRSRWVTSSLQSLCQHERRTRLNELIHLIGFAGGTVLAASKFASGSLTALGLTVASALNLIFGLWPVVLQRYNRLRLYRAIYGRRFRLVRPSHPASSEGIPSRGQIKVRPPQRRLPSAASDHEANQSAVRMQGLSSDAARS